MDALRKEEIYTIDDIYSLPDGERAELIDGKIYYMAPPSRTHQRISGKLYQTIANYIDSTGGKCEIYAAPFAVFLNDDDINYLEPDISVICDQSKFKYRNAGVMEYWIVDPDKQMTMVYGFEKDIVEQYNFGEDVPSGIYEGFVIKVE